MQTKKRAWKAEAGVFLAVAFLAAGALGAAQPATGIPMEVVQLTQFGPAIGVVVLAMLWPSRIRYRLAGSLPVARRTDEAATSALPRPNRRPLWLLLTAPLIIVCTAGAYLGVEGTVFWTDTRSLGSSFTLIVVAQLVGACGEEIGWRCLFQPLVRTRFGPVASSVAVGVVWGVWHVQVFTRAPAYAAGFLAATVAMSVVLGLSQEHNRTNRLLLAGGFHTLVNLGMLLLMDDRSGKDLSMVLFGTAAVVTTVPWVVAARAARILPEARAGALTRPGAR